MQKILFLCSCLEPGKDGIGDYIRKLAEYCKNVGIEIFLLAINDHYIEDNYVKYYNSCRISNKLNQKKKLLITKSIINKFQPQWISLQIMPYSLQSKGIIFNQISFFKKITLGLKIHIMFHELWIGEEKGAPIKNTLIGFLQKK